MPCTTDASTPPDPDEELVEELFTEIASVRGTSKTELPWLADTVDAEALERVWQSADDTLTLSFQYHGCDVTIGGDGVVDVVELD